MSKVKPLNLILTNELNCIKAIFDSHEIMIKTENLVRDSKLRSITCQSSKIF